MNKLKPMIGLEVHVELSTASKMFCRCSADHFAKKPNTLTCPICLGLPGALPFANKEAIDATILLGLAFNCKVNKFSKFDRKHYFYPDLPKGFQISQYDIPFCEGGKFEIPNSKSEIGIRRIHLEEDTAKLIHKAVDGKETTLIDFNRSGVPLLELVTEPDFNNIDDVIIFLKEIQTIVRYLGISTADLEKGQLRFEANVSLHKPKTIPDYRVELKNINSFKFLKNALEYEIQRQKKLIDNGKILKQETRGYNEKTGKTFTQRTKEEAKDYRYFPEPDIPPLTFTQGYIEKVKSRLVDLPYTKRKQFAKLNIPVNYVEILIVNKDRVKYFEKAIRIGKKHNIAEKTIARAMVNSKLDKSYEEPTGLIRKLVELSKKKFASEKETKKAVEEVLTKEKDAVNDYKKGKKQVLGFLIGKTQEKLKGKGKFETIAPYIKSILKND